jgi:hypothetical protein
MTIHKNGGDGRLFGSFVGIGERDVQSYHRELEGVRSDFVDITTIVSKS